MLDLIQLIIDIKHDINFPIVKGIHRVMYLVNTLICMLQNLMCIITRIVSGEFPALKCNPWRKM